MNPRPKRGDMWTCTVCGKPNEPDRSTCINAANHPRPKPPKRGNK
jgi:hypothetical protein